ncbi:MAG TPA: MOSC N-terminal beta barrel domain-containing protein [Ktedonobacteraceae bacterium]|jgi:uncharacterized protein YcbX|nr:MOSC N-terminal beta barrel domain-containing protein [Ktedonobacteraceae bacterium]
MSFDISSYRVSALYIYPIKSCAGIALDEAVIGARGFVHDRAFMLINLEGHFLTQRAQPRMALIHPQLCRDGSYAVQAPGMPELTFSARTTGVRRQVVIWKDTCEAVDQGDDIANWFSAFLGISCRLVAMPNDYIRKVNPHYAISEQNSVGFADGYPFLLISEASLADLNTRLPFPLPMNRFRPNIVVSGTLPYAEDTWRVIRIGPLLFHIVKPCARCPIPTTDQETAQRGKEPLKTLATYRHAQKGVMFGQNLIHEGEGIVRVGTCVEVVKAEATANFTIKSHS